MSAAAKPARWYYGWNVLAVAMCSQMLATGLAGSFSFFVRPWLEAFGGTRSYLLLAIAIGHLCYVLSGLVTGPLFDRLSINRIMGIGLGGTAIGLAALSFVQNVDQVVVAFAFCYGLSSSLGGMLAAQSLAAKWFRGRRGLALGFVAAGQTSGPLLIVPLTAMLLDHFDWRMAVLALAGLAALLIPVVLLVIRNSPEAMGIEPDAPGREIPATQFKASLSLARMLGERSFWLVGLAITVPCAAVGSYVAILEPMTHDAGIDRGQSAFFLELFSAISLLSIAFGRFTDRFDPRRMLMVAIVFDAAGYLLFTDHPGYTRFLVATAFIAIGNSGILPTAGAIIARCFGREHFSRAMGGVLAFLLLGSLSPPVAGAVRDHFNSFDYYLLGISTLMLAFGAGLFWIRLPSQDAGLPESAAPAI